MYDEIIKQFVDGMRQHQALEYIAVFAGIASVWFSRIENIWVYPVGLISTIIYIFLSIEGHLFGEASVKPVLYHHEYLWLGALAEKRQRETLRGNRSILYQARVDAAVVILCDFLCRHLQCTDLAKERFLCSYHTLGRRLCLLHRFHRYVADGQEESGKLVLVDCDQHCLLYHYTLLNNTYSPAYFTLSCL